MVVVVDYEAGNLYNIGNALTHLGFEFAFAGDPEAVSRADRVILPGVGSARAAMDSLRRQRLVEAIRGLRVPFLGICLGMQLLFQRSQEEDCSMLGLLEGTVERFDDSQVKVPHVGWNAVRSVQDASADLFRGIPQSSSFYFVHSFFAPSRSAASVAHSDYGGPFSSAVRGGNFFGVQFHPERSGEIGLKLIRNFLEGDRC